MAGDYEEVNDDEKQQRWQENQRGVNGKQRHVPVTKSYVRSMLGSAALLWCWCLPAVSGGEYPCYLPRCTDRDADERGSGLRSPRAEVVKLGKNRLCYTDQSQFHRVGLHSAIRLNHVRHLQLRVLLARRWEINRYLAALKPLLETRPFTPSCSFAWKMLISCEPLHVAHDQEGDQHMRDQHGQSAHHEHLQHKPEHE